MPADQINEKGAEVFFQHPIGTGPYKFVSWTRNDRMVLEANNTYWGGAPKIKRLIFRAVPEEAARMAELQSGTADIVTNVPPYLVQRLKNEPDVTVQSISSWRVMFVFINTLAEGPLKNKKVRQALNYAVDKNLIVTKLLSGGGAPISTLLPSQMPYNDPSLKPYPYDPARAKMLLSEAGYAGGLKLTFNTCSGRFLMDKEVSEAIAGMLSAVGIQIDFKVVESGTYLQMIVGGKLKDLALQAWGMALGDPDSTLHPLVDGPSPTSYFSSPTITEKIARAARTLDKNKRSAIYQEVQRELYEEAPFIFLYQQMDYYGVSRKVKGFEPRGDEIAVVSKTSK